MQRISTIPGLTIEDMKKLDSVFLAEDRVDSVVLYGSRAKGNYRSGSDIDLTLKSRHLDTRLLAELETKIDDLLLPYNMDISIYNHIESSELIEHIERVGIVIYEK
jgi:predicted nucleotidyltransferase